MIAGQRHQQLHQLCVALACLHHTCFWLFARQFDVLVEKQHGKQMLSLPALPKTCCSWVQFGSAVSGYLPGTGPFSHTADRVAILCVVVMRGGRSFGFTLFQGDKDRCHTYSSHQHMGCLLGNVRAHVCMDRTNPPAATREKGILLCHGCLQPRLAF